MKKFFLITILIAAFSTISLAVHPLVGTWEVRYKIGQLWTDTFTVRAVSNAGKISGVDEWGDKITGWVKNNTAFICGANSDIFHDSYMITTAAPWFAKHQSTCSLVYDFQTSWENANYRKLSGAEVAAFSPAMSREEKQSQKARELKQAQ